MGVGRRKGAMISLVFVEGKKKKTETCVFLKTSFNLIFLKKYIFLFYMLSPYSTASPPPAPSSSSLPPLISPPSFPQTG